MLKSPNKEFEEIKLPLSPESPSEKIGIEEDGALELRHSEASPQISEP